MDYVAFLRGINLGKRRPAMSRLRELFAEMGFEEVATFIASGNVLFTSAEKNAAKLEAQIARQLEASLGYPVDTFVRTAAEVRAIDEAGVFGEDAREGETVHVGFLHEKLPGKTARALEAIKSETDQFRVDGREYYWLCQGRTNESRIWASPALKALQLPSSSMRNLTSIRKLVAKHLDC